MVCLVVYSSRKEWMKITSFISLKNCTQLLAFSERTFCIKRDAQHAFQMIKHDTMQPRLDCRSALNRIQILISVYLIALMSSSSASEFPSAIVSYPRIS